MQEIHLYNNNHLGDNIFFMIFLYQIKNYIEENEIYIYYYCLNCYHRQVKEFICSKNIQVLDYNYPIGINTWIGDLNKKINWMNVNSLYQSALLNTETDNKYTNLILSKRINYNSFFKLFFPQLLEEMNIPLRQLELCYEDPELLINYENLPDEYKNIDILIVNSDPLSGQFPLNNDLWNDYIVILNSKYNIVTTKKIPNVKCTMDNYMTIKTIASISTHAKIIIAVNTGVVPGFFNKYSLQFIKKWFIFDKNVMYDFPNFENKNEITDISFSEIDHYLHPSL